MTRLQEALVRIARDLNLLGVRWALIGALAVAVRAEPRQTADIDVVILVAGDREAEKIVNFLLGKDYSFYEQLEQRTGERLAGMRITASTEEEGSVVIDLLFAFSGIEPEVVEGADVLEILPGLEIPVASTGHLLALKVLAAQERDKDLVDIPLLLGVAREEDLLEAREAVELISQRGVYRGEEDLSTALGYHVEKHRSRRQNVL